MRFILYLLTFVFFLQNTAAPQSRKNKNTFFRLQGQLKGRDTGMIVLWLPGADDQYVKDTTWVKQGKFQFTGHLSEPGFCWLTGSTAEGNSTPFFLESGLQQISLEENKYRNFQLTGSATQKEATLLEQQMKMVDVKYNRQLKEYDSLKNKLGNTTDSLLQSQIGDRISEIATLLNQERLNEKLKFIAKHPGSYVSPAYLYTVLLNRQLTSRSVEDIYNKLSPVIKNSSSGRLIKEELDKRRINVPAENFTAKDIAGEEFTLESYKGKYVLLDFWASWCVPCVRELPALRELSARCRDKGFEVITISIDRDKESWMQGVKKYSIQDFRNVLVNADIDKKYSNTKQPIPSKILINKDGIVIWNSMNQSPVSLEDVLKKELNGL